MEFEIRNSEVIIDLQRRKRVIKEIFLDPLSFLISKRILDIELLESASLIDRDFFWIVFELENPHESSVPLIEIGIGFDNKIGKISQSISQPIWRNIVRLGALIQSERCLSISKIKQTFSTTFPTTFPTTFSTTIPTTIESSLKYELAIVKAESLIDMRCIFAYPDIKLPKIEVHSDKEVLAKDQATVQLKLELVLSALPIGNFSIHLNQCTLIASSQNLNSSCQLGWEKGSEFKIIKESIMDNKKLTTIDSGVNISPRIVLGTITLTLEEFLSLNKGTTLELGCPSEIPVTIEVGNRAWAQAEIRWKGEFLEVEIKSKETFGSNLRLN